MSQPNPNIQVKDEWDTYHSTREALWKALRIHKHSIKLVNIHNYINNTSGDYSLTNESMGLKEIDFLIKKLFIPADSVDIDALIEKGETNESN